MPISVVCQGCGKTLKVKDEWLGKRAKCPGCGESFVVGGESAAPVSTPGVTVFNPHAAAQAKAQREKERGSLFVSAGLMIGIAVALLLGLGITAFLVGPKRVWRQWESLGDKPKNDVIDVVGRGLECYMQGIGKYDPRKAGGQPEAKEVVFFRPTMVMSMPDDVEFVGASNVGPFNGIYHPKTAEVEATVAVGGGIGIKGSNGKKTAGTPVKITGREINGKLTTEVNGKSVVLVFPPPSPNDE